MLAGLLALDIVQQDESPLPPEDDVTEPISLAQAKAQCRVLHDDEDMLIGALIVAAREWVENFTGQVLVARPVAQRFDGFRNLTLHAWPIADDATVAVRYIDGTGASQIVEGARVVLSNNSAKVAPAFGSSWPAAYGPVSATIEAGYASPVDVPQSLKQAMLLLVAHWYANRETVNVGNVTSELPFTVEALCWPYRVRLGIA